MKLVGLVDMGGFELPSDDITLLYENLAQSDFMDDLTNTFIYQWDRSNFKKISKITKTSRQFFLV